MILANEEALTRPYQYYVTVCLSVSLTKQFCEAPVVTFQWFVCLLDVFKKQIMKIDQIKAGISTFEVPGSKWNLFIFTARN